MNKFFTRAKLTFLGDIESGIKREVELKYRDDDLMFCKIQGFETALKLTDIFNIDGHTLDQLLIVKWK